MRSRDLSPENQALAEAAPIRHFLTELDVKGAVIAGRTTCAELVLKQVYVFADDMAKLFEACLDAAPEAARERVALNFQKRARNATIFAQVTGQYVA